MIIHYLQFGQTPCMMEGVPKDWPFNHKWSGDWKHVTCLHCIKGQEIAPTFCLAEDGKSITCLRCHQTSYNANDVQHHYCGHCHAAHDDLWPLARRWWVEHPEPGDKYYVGERKESGVVVVSWRKGTKVTVLSAPDGFEWGYGGSGPAQLALALLLDFVNEHGLHVELAEQRYQRFKEEVVAAFPKERWQLHENQIGNWLRAGRHESD